MDISNTITGAESRGNPTAKNPNSSALGLGQFTKGTWLDMIRRYEPDLAQGKSPDEILAMRTDPILSQQMTAKYAAENQAKLSRAGLPVTPGSTYLMHFAGPSGGLALMKADPNTPVESVLDSSAINANPFLKGKTANWVIDWANKKMADAARAKPSPAPQPFDGKTSIPDLSQTQAAAPSFDATSWLQRPTSPNELQPDAAAPFAPSAGAPRVAPIPFVGGTMKAQQALDNSPPAPGATSTTPANDPTASVRRLSSPMLDDLRANPSQLLDIGSMPFARLPSLASPPSEPSPFDLMLASDRNRAPGDWVQPLPYWSAPSLTQNAPGGLPGLMAQMGAFDPQNSDEPPAGGLVGLLQEWMRNNPDGGSAP